MNDNRKMSALLVPAALIFALNVITTQPSAQTNDPTMKALKLGKIQAKRKRKPNVIKFTPKTPKTAKHLLALRHSLSLFLGSSHPERGHQNIVKVLVAILGIGKFGINERSDTPWHQVRTPWAQGDRKGQQRLLCGPQARRGSVTRSWRS
jgi:hypothetical protein